MIMKKFMNAPENLTAELLEGLAMSSPLVEIKGNNMVVNSKLDSADRVTIVTLGGSGHEPALQGFVGEGMVDIAVVGDIFAAPGYKAVLEAVKLADKGHGVLLVVLNHAGDMLTGDKTMKEALKLCINVTKVVTQEDITTAPRSDAGNRRGFVGCCAVYKIAGAAAAAGKNLEEVTAIAQKLADNMGAISVTLNGCTHPSNGAVLSELAEDEIGIGMGQHGEGGGSIQKMITADETIKITADALIEDLDLKAGEDLLVFINASGATTLMESLILFRAAKKYFEEEKGMKIVANWVDEILTVQETAGFQLFVARCDAEELGYWDAPCNTPYKVVQ